jgi:protein-disulfide isomerase
MSSSRIVPGVKRVVRLAALAATLFLPTQLRAQQKTQDLPLADRTKGSATAKVTVYEMADFQCPWCGKFARETFPTIEKDYINTGKVRWIFINFPIPSLHANALAAAEYASCAALQGRFWPTHDMLYTTQEDWETLRDPAPFFRSHDKALGIKADQLTTCLQTGAGAAMVKSDYDGVQKAGARSTPTFYVEGGLLAGDQPMSVWQPVLDSIIKVKNAHPAQPTGGGHGGQK